MSVAPAASRIATVVEQLRAALSADRVRTGATELDLYKRDASNLTGAAGVVCFPTSTADVQACVRIAVAHDMPFVARGAGTGLAGGATPLDGAMVITTTKMNAVLSVDAVNRLAWVEPGVLNLDLTKAVTHLGLHFAPDPSSQQSCSIGGNVANNSGWASKWCWPTDRWRSSGAKNRSRMATTSAARSWAARACSALPRRCACA
jgi:glycolate oxidase